jgi:hypothetical protein
MPNLEQRLQQIIKNQQFVSNDEFNELALELYKYQYSQNPIYKKICQQRQVEPQNWTQIPLLTTDLFKKQKLYCQQANEPAKIFYSSGTTQGSQSQHYLSKAELELYESSLWATFYEAFNLNQIQNLAYFVLTQSPQEKPNSSLIYMFEHVRQKLAAPQSCYFIKNDSLQTERLMNLLKESISHNIPVLLVGTAFSFVHLLDANFSSVKLPLGSAIMETGGFKGRSREVAQKELYENLANYFGLPLWAIVGQYGMSELGTQYYDRCFKAQSNNSQWRYKKTPMWSRVRILNPEDLQQDVPEGKVGLLAFYDLSNLDSAAFVLSGDLGIKRSNGQFEVLGRAEKLTPKGCSLTTEESLNT